MSVASLKRPFLLLAVVGLVSLAGASVASASEQHPTLFELEGEIMCPTCHTTLDQSNSLEAKWIEAFISARIRAGHTKCEIKAALVSQFGETVLAAPPRRGWDLLAWWLPIVGVVAGAAILAVGAWRWSHLRGEQSADAPVPLALDPDLERRLDDELARL
jgi:cytochrome c-type biogenesis protein CcmH